VALWSKEVFAKNLRKYMESRGITQKELAEKIGVSAPTMNDWLQAKKYPRIDKIEKLADYFGVLKSDLIEEKSEEHFEMQKTNDVITDIITRLRTDTEFLHLVRKLNSMEEEKLHSVIQMLNVFTKKSCRGGVCYDYW
jgi:transcriptional regulator with XRE-family HTH domain